MCPGCRNRTYWPARNRPLYCAQCGEPICDDCLVWYLMLHPYHICKRCDDRGYMTCTRCTRDYDWRESGGACTDEPWPPPFHGDLSQGSSSSAHLPLPPQTVSNAFAGSSNMTWESCLHPPSEMQVCDLCDHNTCRQHMVHYRPRLNSRLIRHTCNTCYLWESHGSSTSSSSSTPPGVMETDEPGNEPEPNNGQALLSGDTGSVPSVPGIWHDATIAVAAAAAAVVAAAQAAEAAQAFQAWQNIPAAQAELDRYLA